MGMHGSIIRLRPPGSLYLKNITKIAERMQNSIHPTMR